MVVLEGGGGVVTIGTNQYLQPDYLAPMPATVSIKCLRIILLLFRGSLKKRMEENLLLLPKIIKLKQ